MSTLANQIETAFAEVAQPSPDELVAPFPNHTELTTVQTEVRDRFAHRHWRNLELRERDPAWSGFIYLRPEALQYYVPGFLTAALDDEALGWTSIVYLKPNYCRVHHGQSAVEWESAFSAAQRAAVVAFLRHLATTHSQFGPAFAAAGALKWRWDPAHPDLYDQFVARLHRYRRPTISDPEVEQLAQLVEQAFANATYPGDDDIVAHHCEECCEYGVDFMGADWRTIHPDLLNFHYAAPSMFTPHAFRFFMPAFWIAQLCGHPNQSIEFHLTYGLADPPGSETRLRAEKTFRPFAPEERRAIVALLEHELKTDSFGQDKIAEALETYWLPSLTS